MPRIVDVVEQRAHLAHAVWRLAARSGLGAVSLREVAAEAGVSMGRVQHYFASKDELLLFGLELAQLRMQTRVEQRLTALPHAAGDEDVLRAVLEEMLGEDPDTKQVIRVCLAYYPQALKDERVAAVLTAADPELHQLAAEVVRHAQDDGRAAPGLDPDQEARVLWHLAASLGVEVALDRLEVEAARATLRYQLQRALGSDENPERRDPAQAAPEPGPASSGSAGGRAGRPAASVP